MFPKLYIYFATLLNREEGQDLVEYALVVALIAFGAVISMKGPGIGGYDECIAVYLSNLAFFGEPATSVAG